MTGGGDTVPARAGASAHPARTRILRLSRATRGCVGQDVLGAAGRALSAFSGHPRILAAADVITGGTDGPRVWHAPDPAAPARLSVLIGGLACPPQGARGRNPAAVTA
jgi:hypothetical protein